MSFFSSLKDRLADSTLSQLWQKPLDGEQKPSLIGRLNNIFVGGFAGNSTFNSGGSSTALKQVSQNLQLSESDIKAHLQREAGQNQFAKVAVNNLNEPQGSSEIPPEKRVFKTNGGEWRKSATDDVPRFYRTGDDTSGTQLYDEEYYRPDPAKYPQTNGKWIRLNPNGETRDLPQYKGTPRPENISEFDWKGFEWVDGAQVPANYRAEGKTVAFSDSKNAESQLNVLKRYVVDHNLVGSWDEAKFQQIFGASAGNEIRLELTEAGKNADGKTVFNVQMSGESLAKLREGLLQYNRETTLETQAGADGQKQATFMAGDTLKVYGNAV